MRLSVVAQAISIAAARLGMNTSAQADRLGMTVETSASKALVQAASTAIAVSASSMSLAYELGNWILRLNWLDPVGADDGAGVLNELFVQFFKTKTDSAALADFVATEFHKNLNEGAGLTDSQIVAFFKRFQDEAAVSDAIALVSSKPFADQFEVLDQAVALFSKDLKDAAGITDFEIFAFFKVLFDEAAIQDVHAFELYKTRTDAFGASDLSVQHLVKNFFENLYVTDDLDGDATLLDEQRMEFVKQRTEIVGITDVIQLLFVVIRVFEDQAAVTEFAQLGLEKPRTDAAVLFDVVARDTAKRFFEISSSSDQATLAAFKSLADQSLLQDSLSKAVGSALVESTLISDVGLVSNQNYCGSGYFAEDYVGVSRTF